MKRYLLLAVIAGGAITSLGAVPNVSDSFDTLYTNGYTFDTPSNGWRASSSAAMVTNGSGAYSAPNAAFLNGTVSMTNTLITSPNLKIWTDMRIKPYIGELLAGPETNLASFYSYFTTNGYLCVATPSGFQVCSNDIWGSPVPPATNANAYVRLSVFQDYTTARQAVLLNDQLILQDAGFVVNMATYSQLLVQNSDSNCWLDNVWVATNIGPDSLVYDRNGDSRVDALEIQTYGYASRTQYVGGAGYPSYGSIAAAVAAARSRDTIYIPTAPAYAEDILVSNTLTFTGGVFTNTGALTVSATTGVVFKTGMDWGSVILDTNTTVTFTQWLVCSNLTVRSGATVTVANVTCSNVTVEANALLNCQGTFACANLLTCTGTVSLAAAQSLTASSVTLPGVLLAAAGATATVSTALSLPISGHMDFTTASFVFTPLSVDMTGTFSLSNHWGQGNSVAMPAGAHCTFNQALTNPPLNSLELGTNSTVTFSKVVVCGDLTVRSGSTVVMSSLTCSNLVVEPGAHFTCSGAFHCYGNCTFGQNAVVAFSGSTACAGVLTVASGASVTLGQGATLGALDVIGTLIVGAGQTVTVTAATVTGSVLVSGAGTISVGAALSVTGGGTLTFASGRLTVPASNVDMSGTFAVSNTWGTAMTMALPFSDNFELYANNTVMTNLGFRGWYASDGSVKVENTVKHAGNNATEVPDDAVLSNSINSATMTKIWTDFYIQPTLGLEPVSPATNSSSFLAYANTNGYLVVAVAGGGWVVCSNRIDGAPATLIPGNAFTRISVYQELVHHTFAVFVAGDLVAQGLNTPANLGGYTAFALDNIIGTAYLDDLSMASGVPAGLTSDWNHNNIPDAVEISDNEIAALQPLGTIFKIR